MMTDPISDLIIQIKNGYMAKNEKIEVSYSKLKEMLVSLMSKEGYLGKIKVNEDKSGRKTLEIHLSYSGKIPKMSYICRMSKISRRMYANKKSIPKVLGGKGIMIVSTPQGLMIDSEARKKGMGGELICKMW